MINIDELIKDSLKNKKAAELKVYRNLKADIMAFKTQKNAPEYNEASEISIIRKYATKMEDAEKQYSQAGREDLITECREELEVLRKLLPEPVSPVSIGNYLAAYCLQHGFVTKDTFAIPKKSMGIIIKAIKEKFPTVDGKIISEVVKQYVV